MLVRVNCFPCEDQRKSIPRQTVGMCMNALTGLPYGAASPPWSALERVLDDGCQWIHLIWHSDSIIESFHEVYSQKGVSVFQYDL